VKVKAKNYVGWSELTSTTSFTAKVRIAPLKRIDFIVVGPKHGANIIHLIWKGIDKNNEMAHGKYSSFLSYWIC
jgi:hypothetical protein